MTKFVMHIPKGTPVQILRGGGKWQPYKTTECYTFVLPDCHLAETFHLTLDDGVKIRVQSRLIECVPVRLSGGAADTPDEHPHRRILFRKGLGWSRWRARRRRRP
jgi:hypothetical protein